MYDVLCTIFLRMLKAIVNLMIIGNTLKCTVYDVRRVVLDFQWQIFKFTNFVLYLNLFRL